MKYFIIALTILTQHYVRCNPCPAGEYMYGGQCNQMQYRCPPNTVYNGGVCVAQQYIGSYQPNEFSQAPTSCGGNMVLYNNRCQSQNVATCPYTSTLQNGLCMRNQPAQLMQPYSMQSANTFSMAQPQPMGVQMLSQPMSMQTMGVQTLPQAMSVQTMPQTMGVQTLPQTMGVQTLPQIMSMPQSAQTFQLSSQPMPMQTMGMSHIASQPMQMMRPMMGAQHIQMIRPNIMPGLRSLDTKDSNSTRTD